MAASNLAEQLGARIDAHEERISHTEKTVSGLAVQVARVEEKQDTLQKSVDTGFRDLQDSVQETLAHLSETQKTLVAYQQRLEPLEVSYRLTTRRDKERRELLKKVLVGVLLAAAGVLGTKGLEIVLKYLP